MKLRGRCIGSRHRRACTEHVRSIFFVFSLLTADNLTYAEGINGNSALFGNAVAHTLGTSASVATGGSMQPLTGARQGSEGNSLSTVASKAVASDVASSAKFIASNAAIPSQTSSVSTQTASAGTSSNASASPSTATATTLSSATATSGIKNATAANATNSTVVATGTTSSNHSATAIASATNPNTATSSQTSSVAANLPVGSPTIALINKLAPNAGQIPLQPTPEGEEPQNLGDILDLRPAAKLKASLWPWVIVLLVVLSAVGLWFLLKRKRPGKKKKEKPAPPIDPYEEVLRALKEVSQKLDVDNPKPFAFFLTDAVRLYLSRIFRLPAPECTTQELLQQLPWCTKLTDELRTNITHFLQQCDLVKFTTMPFDEPFLLQLHQQAEAIVAASRELTKPKPAPVASAAPNATPSSNPQKTSKK